MSWINKQTNKVSLPHRPRCHSGVVRITSAQCDFRFGLYFSFSFVPEDVLMICLNTLWRSVLNARASECQKLKMVGYTSMAKYKALTASAVKGLISRCGYVLVLIDGAS